MDGEVLGKGADKSRRNDADVDGRERAAIMLDISFRLVCFIREPISPRGERSKSTGGSCLWSSDIRLFVER
jgi:hypothetical protein